VTQEVASVRSCVQNPVVPKKKKEEKKKNESKSNREGEGKEVYGFQM
jgi:hypothetical protein